MEEELKSEGKCIYCKETFSKTGISKHLAKHLQDIEKKIKAPTPAFHVRVSSDEMFLNLLVSSEAQLGELDDFLRAIWLECCGHMSSFRLKGKRYDISFDEDSEFGESMEAEIKDVFRENAVFKYEYDFGSTTTLEVKVLKPYYVLMDESIILLSRNEPLAIMCGMCKTKPAVKLCTVHIYEEHAFYCKDCQKKHAKVCEDFNDYAALPVVNSPRMGVCAYDGGTIDKKRDGAFKV
jgi:Plasmid pRiA4b ORF-3-like protein